MNRKVKVPPEISKDWRSFGLARDLAIAFWTYVQTEIPANYAKLRANRFQGGRGFKHKKVFKDTDGIAHLFVLIIDDESSPDDLIILNIQHIRR